MKNPFKYFSRGEIILWLSSVTLILTSFLVFGKDGYLSLIASLLGVTSLIFIARGNPIGQVLIIIFCILYGIISYGYSYYGEMATYLFMSAPMACLSLLSWLRNPYEKGHSEVKVNKLKSGELLLLVPLSLAVTVVFYFVLKHFGTANLIPSTFSVLTSFIAVYLTFRRSPYYALAYTVNDVVLIILWTMAAFTDSSYVSVVACFVAFLANDVHGFISWQRMQKRQHC